MEWSIIFHVLGMALLMMAKEMERRSGERRNKGGMR